MGYGAEGAGRVERFVTRSMGVKKLRGADDKYEQDAQERDDGPEIESRFAEVAKCDCGLHWIEGSQRYG
jgi:hypothetical protein